MGEMVWLRMSPINGNRRSRKNSNVSPSSGVEIA